MPPAQVARKPLPRRNTYDPPSAVIHPIIEADEDGSLHDGDITSEPVSPVRDTNPSGRRDSDPFLTPTHEKLESGISFPPSSRASQTPSPENRRRTTDPEVQDWMSDVEAMDALLTSRTVARAATNAGQISPTKRGPGKSNRFSSAFATEDESRTESNISESSRSILGGVASRSGSVRSAIRSGIAALSSGNDEGRGGSSQRAKCG